MSRRSDVEIAKEVFLGLQLADWVEDTQPLKGGGQAAVLVLKRRDGVRGVFRFLRSKESSALTRFFREVELLTDPDFQHPSIVRLLDWTKDDQTPWYISELGHSFHEWWESVLEANIAKPTAIVSKAVSCLLSLTDGLSRLHKAACVHRDIKPENLIVSGQGDKAVPVLIDFGVAYVEDPERLTHTDEAVGNRRFSPDIAMNRMDKVTPWLDVFQLSQLLMWMVAKRPAKDRWPRPVDWRWVNYPDQLPYEFVAALRSVTALCSEEALAPKDAGALHSSLRTHFDFSSAHAGAGPVTFNVAAVRAAVMSGRATAS